MRHEWLIPAAGLALGVPCAQVAYCADYMSVGDAQKSAFPDAVVFEPVVVAADVKAAIVSVAGLPVERFVFEGFLPSRAGARRERIRALAGEQRALVFLEAPTRLAACLADLTEILGDRDAVLGRELTKLHEECVRGPLGELRARADAMAAI